MYTSLRPSLTLRPVHVPDSSCGHRVTATPSVLSHTIHVADNVCQWAHRYCKHDWEIHASGSSRLYKVIYTINMS